MSKVTYLLGAGASANALPVLNTMNTRLHVFKQHLSQFLQSAQTDPTYYTHIEPGNRLVNDINFFLKEMSNHLTVDTYARKLFARKSLHKDLRRLKQMLSSYFVFEQLPITNELGYNSNLGQPILKECPDKRYDSLVASLLSFEIDNLSLANDVKVLSWNYDIQLELAYMLFSGLQSLKQTHNVLQVVPGKHVNQIKVDLRRFSLVHLNGVAGYKNLSKDDKKDLSIIDQLTIEPLDTNATIAAIVKYHDELSNHEAYGTEEPEEISYFNYSWENKSENHRFLNQQSKVIKDTALEIARYTDILVVIGYSFPVFNRWYDTELIEKMGGLKKIYIQDLNPEHIRTTMKNAFSSIDYLLEPNRVSLSNNLNQFVIPSELNL